MRLRLIGLFCLIVASFTVALAQNKKACTRNDAIQAESQASSLQTWRQVYSSYKRFVQCDDGAIGEGYSDSVARLLSDHWDTTGDLLQLVSHDKDFEQFVLRHIDELISPSQAKKIRANATSHCPSPGIQLCKSIISELKETPSSVKP